MTSSNAQELEFLSDSDWLDISSGQEESDDNDSVLGSDNEGSLPLSRRSSISAGSSADGQVEAWEGFTDDSPHAVAAIDPLPTTTDVIPDIVNITATRNTSSDSPVSSLSSSVDNLISHAVDEELRVRAALDQSMMSTLSSSRSSSAGHNSTRDLRLSFPDPLTSSRNELDRSYDDVSPTTSSSMDECFQSEFSAPIPSQEQACDQIAMPVEDHIAAKDVIHPSDGDTFNVPTTCQLDIVLYGSSSTKWVFVETLLSKVAVGGGAWLASAEPSHNDSTHYHLRDAHRDIHIAVYDMADKSVDDLTHLELNQTSLAIVHLPWSNPTVGDHAFYLPVFAPTQAEDIDKREAAQNTWASLDIQSHKVLSLKGGDASVLFDTADLANLDPCHAHQVFEDMQPAHVKSKSRSQPQFKSIHAATFVALLSVIFGMASVGLPSFGLRPAVPGMQQMIPKPTSTHPLWGFFGPAINQTAAISSTAANPCSALIPSSLKDLALAVFNPAATSPSPYIPTAPPQKQAADWKVSSTPSWTDRILSSKDVILRPVSSPSVFEAPSKSMLVENVMPSPSQVESSVAPKPSQTTTSLSTITTNVVSLSKTVDETMKAVAVIARHDLHELYDAIDDLTQALGQQTVTMVHHSKGAGKHLREALRYRNDRARGRARQLRFKGGQIMASAGERIKGRAERARMRARVLRERVQELAATVAAEAKGDVVEEHI